MSIATDLASLEVLAKILKKKELDQILNECVKTLNKEVPNFDWVGIYLHKGPETHLVAASDLHHHLDGEANAQLSIPLENNSQEQMGKIVIRSKDPFCFDTTDVTTLETLARELSLRLLVH